MARLLKLMVIQMLLLCAVAGSGPLSLCDFDKDTTPSQIKLSDATVSYEDGAITVHTGHQQNWPGVTLNAPDAHWDLSERRHVCVDVENLSAETVRVHLRVDDPKADGNVHCLTGSRDISPGQTATVKTALYATPWVFKKELKLIGMRGYPQLQDKLDTADICRVLIFVSEPKTDYTFRVRNLRAEDEIQYLDAETFLPFIDRFGQFRHADWPGKIHSELELADARLREQKELADNPSPADWNQYGGWTKGPKQKATGFFRVEKINSNWWLIDPEGRLFWSHGSDSVNPGAATPITGRENYFAWLPKEDGPFKQFYGQGNWAPHGYYNGKGTYKTFDFARANLQRKYGQDAYQTHARLCHQRLRSWGMNTIGNWSDAGIYLKRKTPYVVSIHASSRSIEGSEGYWGKFYDVFDASFSQSLRQRLEREKGNSVGDPWCLGYFVHNELAWGDETSLAIAALASGADQPAKIEFAKDLKAKYGQIEKLNQQWDSDYPSWDAFLESRDKPDIEKARSDLTAFYSRVAETYFKTVRDELRRAAPNQLYLGCRFAWVNDRAAAAAIKYCDVVSYNRYVHSVADFQLPKNADKPVIIGEFHFGSLDRGMFHTGLVPVASQNDRAQKYREYVLGALRNPYIVGTHWFQFRDQAATGRGDGENYQIGLLDVCDNPYSETIEAVRQIGNILYEYRYITSESK